MLPRPSKWKGQWIIIVKTLQAASRVWKMLFCYYDLFPTAGLLIIYNKLIQESWAFSYPSIVFWNRGIPVAVSRRRIFQVCIIFRNFNNWGNVISHFYYELTVNHQRNHLHFRMKKFRSQRKSFNENKRNKRKSNHIFYLYAQCTLWPIIYFNITVSLDR